MAARNHTKKIDDLCFTLGRLLAILEQRWDAEGTLIPEIQDQLDEMGQVIYMSISPELRKELESTPELVDNSG